MKNYRKHIILISIDTLRADCINKSPRAKNYLNDYNVKNRLKTDCLDEILGSSLYFNNCFSSAPYTSASHAAYFTGLWPLHNGIYEFYNRKLIKPTIFQYAKEQGYKTIFQTDFPIILGKSLGFTNSIDNYFVEDENKAFETLIKNKTNKTMSFFHFGGVHYPYGFHTLKFGGKDYINKIKSLEEKYHVFNSEKHKLDDVLNETFRNKKDTELLLRYKYIIFEKLYKHKKYDDIFDLYLEGINYFLEHRFNKFISKIKNFIDKNDAVLFIFSDHGEEWNSFSEGHHNTLSDNVLRVPLMVYGNGIKAGIENKLIRTIDLAPTVINMFPNPVDVKTDGQELNIFNSKKNSITKYAISQVYTSMVSKKQLSEYQNLSIKGKENIKPLKTFLSGEVIRNKKDMYLAYYDKNNTIKCKKSIGKVKRLKNKLNNYNLSKIKEEKKISEVELKVRNELRNLGYNI